MNKQIKALLTRPVFERLNDWYNIGPVQRATIEEFGELIVQECIGRIETMLNSMDENSSEDEWLSGYDAGARRAIKILKLDFGIKQHPVSEWPKEL